MQVGKEGEEIKRINIDFPQWMVDEIDSYAKQIGVTRQSVIKLWLWETLKKRKKEV